MRMLRSVALALGSVFAFALATPRDAEACGVLPVETSVLLPSVRGEQVLIVHDAERGEEHFIREVVFDDALDPFGFIVPTPTQPTVHEVADSPFRRLARRFPPEPDPPPHPELGAALASGPVGAVSAVRLISEQRIGAFTAFVLAANDATALEKWLRDNRLTTTAQTRRWLDHYVKLGFFFVALRHEVAPRNPGDGSDSVVEKPATAGELSAQTVRISFATPLPFYPYKEPEPTELPEKKPRVLAVWLVSTLRSVPVAVSATSGQPRWKRPWDELRTHADPSGDDLRAALGPSLGALLAGTSAGSSAKPWHVQTFEDQKSNRRGWGDVVLVPAQHAPSVDLAKVARLAPSISLPAAKP